MKRFLLPALLLALSSSLLAETLFEENFESYEVGTEMVGTIDGWDTFSTYGGSSTIVENESGISHPLGWAILPRISSLSSS